MKKIKLVTVVGTRPEIIRLSRIINKFDEYFAVDGGSTDGTLDFYKTNNVDIVGQSKKGRGEAFLLAFQKSSSDILIFFIACALVFG